jgi:tripartite ATP-independent transporter DctM subunit
MDNILIGYLGLGLMVLLIFYGIPIGYAMTTISILGLAYVASPEVAFTQVSLLAWEKGTDPVLTSIPLFVLMGQLVFQTRIVTDMFDCIRKWAGHLPGGLTVAAVIACAGFGAVTGSTLAACATMGATIMPELKKYKYDMSLASGTIAAAAGLACIIPPSVGMILFGLLTDTSIAALFVAGVVPGLILTFVYSAWVVIKCIKNPEAGPRGEVFSWYDRIVSLKQIMPVVVLFVVVIGGIYIGVFTPTEAAGIGVTGVMIIAMCMRRLTAGIFLKSAIDSAKLSTIIYVVIVAGYLMARFLTTCGTSNHLIDTMVGLQLNKYTLIAIMTVLYLVLGCLLDTFGLTILTVPILYPITVSYGIDPVWFGIFFTLMCGVALITPPVGMHAYVLHGVCPEIPSAKIFRGALPFCIWHMLVALLVTIFPAIVLWLPNSM